MSVPPEWSIPYINRASACYLACFGVNIVGRVMDALGTGKTKTAHVTNTIHVIPETKLAR